MKIRTAVPFALAFVLVISFDGRTHSSASQKPAPGNIPEGIYTIVGEASHRCIEVPNNTCAAGMGLQIFTCDPANTSNNQKFIVKSDGAGYYTISPAHSDLCLELSSDKIADRTPIVQTECVAGRESQKWAMSQYGVNLEIRDVGTNRCLDIFRKGKGDFAPIFLQTCGVCPKQRWRLQKTTINAEHGVICRESADHPALECAGINDQQKEVHLGKTLTKAKCEEACRVNKMSSCKWGGSK
jgi:hypothetical protein